MKYSPGARDDGIVEVQLLLSLTSSPIPHVPVGRSPEIKPASSILNYMYAVPVNTCSDAKMTVRTQLSEEVSASVQDPPQLAM